MKKAIFTTILAGAMALTLAACGGTGGTGQTAGSHEAGKTDGAVQGVGSVQSVYGLSAVTTATLLEETKVAAKPLAAVLADPTADPNATTDPTADPNATNDPTADPNASADPAPDQNNSDYQGLPDAGSDAAQKAQTEADRFNKYFTMLEGFMEKGATTTVVTENDAADEALKDYAYKLVVTGRNVKGEENAHTMYYSETVKTENRELKDDDDDDDGEVKTVSVYTLEGVLEMGKNDDGETVYYYMNGVRTEETETDGKETETSSKLEFYASAVKGDRSDCVKVTHETETEEEGRGAETETEYTYEVYQAGKRVETTSVDFETENKEVEYELSYSNAQGDRTVYEIELTERGSDTLIEVEYTIGGTRGKFVIVRDADGTYEYKFSKSSTDDRHFAR